MFLFSCCRLASVLLLALLLYGSHRHHLSLRRLTSLSPLSSTRRLPTRSSWSCCYACHFIFPLRRTCMCWCLRDESTDQTSEVTKTVSKQQHQQRKALSATWRGHSGSDDTQPWGGVGGGGEGVRFPLLRCVFSFFPLPSSLRRITSVFTSPTRSHSRVNAHDRARVCVRVPLSLSPHLPGPSIASLGEQHGCTGSTQAPVDTSSKHTRTGGV